MVIIHVSVCYDHTTHQGVAMLEVSALPKRYNIRLLGLPTLMNLALQRVA